MRKIMISINQLKIYDFSYLLMSFIIRKEESYVKEMLRAFTLIFAQKWGINANKLTLLPV